jgi:molybdopterin synthase sulfur carrier subunit
LTPDTAITILIPGALRQYCEGATELSLSATSVRDSLEQLGRRYPGLYRNICDETGAVRRHVNLFVNTSHIRDRQGLDTTLVDGDVIAVIPAVSGG